MIELKDFKPRLYQENIFETAKSNNTLVVLPTGTGKTAIALLVAINRLNKFPNSKVLVCSPTKPLSQQHLKTFQRNTTINKEDIVLLTGAKKPKNRANLWNNAMVVIATPQTIESDLKNDRINLKEVSLLVIDEAHRSRQRFANTIVTKDYNENAVNQRVLALTASPGSTKEKINEIMENLNLDAVEIRTESDEDIKPYLQERKIEWVNVDLPLEFKKVKDLLKNASKKRLKGLKKFGVTKPLSLINKKDLIDLQNRFGEEIKKKNLTAYYGASLVAQIIKLEHTIELLETQSLNAVNRFLKGLETDKSKAAKAIMMDKEVIQATNFINKLIEKEIKHPKLHKLIEIVVNNFKSNKDSRVIIFANYRYTVKDIVKELNNVKGIKAVELLGQKEGVTQKKQIETIKKFEEGTYNILIGTSISEEGLDIAGADLAIFYDNVSTAIRRIQRGGRVARLEAGKIIFLITKGTRDEAYYWKSKHEEKRMRFILKKMQDRGVKQSSLDKF